MPLSQDILGTYLHFRDDGRADTVPVTDAFWADLSAGRLPQLDQGRLMTAFTFSEPWATWERHPAGEELVLLLSGAADLVLDLPGGEQVTQLQTPGAYVLVPPNVWHTARTSLPTTLLFLTPGAGTEHRPIHR
ncbi:cupin domain-containing protein [Hylemonella gracilis]|uniref:Cupin domain-containing protein n=1 Tax=Hylemonella gracilis ATCC 19624 TaxID=887062 RepID=F3KS73_9BURK|nr:cupin domain-containing protein [Hylemonella gracilis]EGI77433.1 cupin domain-containing protein [Hylemonella gracilis ATCC 19624]